jgi:phosphatidylserine decarboxylase
MTSRARSLPVWGRRAEKRFEEFMEDAPQTYETRPQRSVRQWLEAQPLYDWLIALYQESPRSARKIKPFIQMHHIDMSEFKPVAYRSYAEFFDREFLPDARPFTSNPNELAAFAEARYFGWERLKPDQELPIKGKSLDAVELLGSIARAKPFMGGPVIVARLAPVDYHHAHYPDDGRTCDHTRLGRSLWTVGWKALQNKPDIYIVNERQVNILETTNFGRLGFVEIGALSVGRIVQKHPLDRPFHRGDEKAVFKFGGSAIVVFGEPGKWKPADDILAHTQENMETLIRLGEPIGQRRGSEQSDRHADHHGAGAPLTRNRRV